MQLRGAQDSISETEVIDRVISLSDYARLVRKKDRSIKLGETDFIPTDALSQVSTPTLMEYGLQNNQNQVCARLLKAILRDIVNLNNQVGIGDELLDVPLFNGRMLRLIHVPASKDFDRLRRNERIEQWTDRLLECLFNATHDKSINT